MSVETSDSKRIYPGDGVVAAFTTPFFALDQDIQAIFRPSGGGFVQLTADVHFTLAGAGAPGGGTLTITDIAYLPSSTTGTLVILNVVTATQLRRFPRGGGIDNKEYEAALDKLTMICQQIIGELGASIHAPVDDIAGSMELPLDSTRANGFLGFDATGLPIVYDYAGLVNLLRPGIIGTVVTKTVMLSREELGLIGDGVTDDSVALQAAIETWSAAGGATFFLQPQSGKSFYLKYGVVIRSGIQMFMSGGGFSGSKAAYVHIEGDVATEPTTNVYQLTADATAGATQLFVDTGPQGGGAVSAHFPVGIRIVVYGETNGAGNTMTRDELLVTASNSNSITVTPAISFDYPITYPSSSYTTVTGFDDYTYIVRAIQAPLLTDAPEGVNTFTLTPGQTGQFAIGDYVLIESDKVCSDIVVGASAERTHVEIRQIIDIDGDGADTITLNGYLERTYEIAYAARITRLNPAMRAMVQGASFAFTEAPDASPAPQVHTFEMRRAVECSMIDCEVSNEDAFGSRGAMFQDWECYRCRWVAPDGRNPKSLSGGDGRGYVSAYSTECECLAPEIAGCRRNISFHGATLGRVLAPSLGDDREGSLSFAGCYEAGCVATEVIITGGSRLAPGANDRSGVRLGDQTNRVGPYRCGVELARLANYRGANYARAVQVFPGAIENSVKGHFDDVETVLYQGDTPGATALAANGLTIEGTVNGCVGWLVDCNGGRHGSASRTLQNLKLALRIYGAGKHVFLQQVGGAQIQIDVDQVAIDASEPYMVKAIDVTGLEIARSTMRGARAGFSLQTCPAAMVMDNRFINFSGGTIILTDNGGNTSAQWVMNFALGFTGTLTVPGTPSSGLRYWPLAITSTADFLVEG